MTARTAISLRWQALRECLALDTRTGFWTLTAIARSGEDLAGHSRRSPARPIARNLSPACRG
ncbi:hypothetical protein OKA06_17080 [Novosphingobium sp. MW5]|nr:hypothetical protein [Novosphingobium sp. MW5]